MSAHPPFQIDGNLGLTAAIAEALVQSHRRRDLAAARAAAAVAAGAVQGLRARGGVIVDIEWDAGRLVRARLHGGPQPTTMDVSDPNGPIGTYNIVPGAVTVLDAGERGTSW